MSQLISTFSKHLHWPEVRKIILTLNQKNFKSYLAGGCVRDALLGQIPKDFDIATEARPEEVIRLFPNSDKQGRAFGVVAISCSRRGGENGERGVIEVATFRRDGLYRDGRHPEAVEFLSDREDAFRRDLTVNALFYSLEGDRVIDYVGGLEDLRNKVIRTVGEAQKRFQEDHLRILRAIRFSIQLGFKIEPITQRALFKMRFKLFKISRERVYEECLKILKLGNYVEALLAFKELDILESFCPMLEEEERGLDSWAGNLEFYLKFWKQAFQEQEDEAFIWTQAFFPLLFQKREELLEKGTSQKRISQKRISQFRQSLRDWKFPLGVIRGVHTLFFDSLCILDIKSVSLGKKLKIRDSELASKIFILSRNTLKSKNLKPDIIDKIEQAFQERICENGKLPSPLVNGNDLKDLKVPADNRRAIWLEELYEFQLENKLVDKNLLLERLKSLVTSL